MPTAPNIDTSAPHPARVYNYWLGGKDNFQADRQAAQAAMEIFDGLELVPPGVVQISQWRPDSAYDSDLPAALWGGVARKP